MFRFDKIFKKKMSLHYDFIETQAVFASALFEVFLLFYFNVRIC